MSPNSRRYLMMLIAAVTFLALRLIEVQLSVQLSSTMPQCRRHELEEIQDDLVHMADSCSVEKMYEEDTFKFLQIRCHVNDLPEGYERRLEPVDYGRSIFLNQRIPKPLKRQWNFRVPVDAVDGVSLLT